MKIEGLVRIQKKFKLRFIISNTKLIIQLILLMLITLLLKIPHESEY